MAHMFSCIQNMTIPVVGECCLGTASLSQLQESDRQRNIFNGKYLFKNLKDINFQSLTTFHHSSYMQEKLTLFLWELQQDLENLTLYMTKLCIR